MQLLVINLLKDTARRYFGTDSDLRKERLPEIQARHRAGKDSQERARKRRRTEFRRSLRRNMRPLQDALATAEPIEGNIDAATRSRDEQALLLLQDKVLHLQSTIDELRLPPLPSKLGDYEQKYREYRDDFETLCSMVDRANLHAAKSLQKVVKKPPEQVAREYFEAYSRRLSAKLEEYASALKQLLDEFSTEWTRQSEHDERDFSERSTELVKDIAKGSRLTTVLNALDAAYAEADGGATLRCEASLRALRQLLDNIDLDNALSVTDDERLALEENLREFHGLAQLGIAIEIIGHELETMEENVERHLKRLPGEVRSSRAYERAYESFHALADRLRFLAPMKMAGYRARQKISGDQIAAYVQSFFGKRFEESRTEFATTDEFRRIVVTDLPSRIFPVFINLVNNSLYWLQFVRQRQIVFDCIDENVVVADSGEGVDREDVKHLFELFFTRRANGRGVGLYLCRANLAVAHHAIRYAQKGDPQVLDGAQFVIQFRGLEHA